MPRRPAEPVAVRRPWLHVLALGWGAVVLLGHVMTYGDVVPRWLHHLEPPDIVKHLTGIGLFTVLYRASWVRGADEPKLATNLMALLVCAGWGMLCESLQLFVPLRDFDLRELALNTLSPAALIGLWALVEQVWD